MSLGPIAEQVTVVTEPPLIEPTKTELSRVVSMQEIESLPISGRNFVDFVKLSSGVARGRENVGGGAFKEPDVGVGSRGRAAPVVRRPAGAEHDDPGGRRRQRPDVHGPAARDAVAGGGQGIPRPQLDVPRGVRPRPGRLREHRDQVGHEPRATGRSTTSGWTTS